MKERNSLFSVKRVLPLVLLCIAFLSVPARAGFREKPISSGSVNQTGKYTAKKVSGAKSGGGFVSAMSNASVRLLQESVKESGAHDNVLISPDSILTAVTMAGNGAAGSTMKEMKSALGGISPKQYSRYLFTLHKRVAGSSLVKYTSANSIWYKKGKIRLKKSFLQMLVNYYSAQVYAAPFNASTVQDINRWVYNHTNGKIGKILNQLPRGARTVLINAIYFRGKWVDPYTHTAKRSFTKSSGGVQKVTMLESTEHSYVTVNGAEGFVKPYLGGTTAFMALLPPEGMSVDQYISGLTGDALIGGYKNRVTRNILVHTRMPKFKYEYTISLKKPLAAMGMRSAFTDQANFSKMSKQRVKIDEVLHKTFISVTKDGTEAAAVTAVVMKASSMLPMQDLIEKYVYLDRPFVYAIIDVKTGLPLFLGAVKKV